MSINTSGKITTPDLRNRNEKSHGPLRVARGSFGALRLAAARPSLALHS